MVPFGSVVYVSPTQTLARLNSVKTVTSQDLNDEQANGTVLA